MGSGIMSPLLHKLRLRQTPDLAYVLLLTLTVAAAGCGRNGAANVTAAEAVAAPVRIQTAAAVERPITRFLRASGTLTAQDSAEVAAEIAGPVVATPVERGMPVRAGAHLVRIAATEAEAQALEADANVAQIQARLGQVNGEAALDLDRVPEVASAKATHDLAQADFARTRTLFEQKLLPRSEFELRQAQVETTRRQYEVARNGVLQQHQALAAANARATLARKALDDTIVRAPFDGVVAERLVSIGDYVTRGTKVASVMRINPLRVELTVPAQHMAAVAVGRQVSFSLDAFPGETFTGHVRYVSPDVRTDSRALVVEAVVPNEKGALKPGLFATAQIEDSSTRPGVLVPAAAVRTSGGTSRVFVLSAGHVEETIVTLGQPVGDLIEVTTGVTAGDVVAIDNINQLVDGMPVIAGEASTSGSAGGD
jgi:RND family efflux transporter MFP subunit